MRIILLSLMPMMTMLTVQANCNSSTYLTFETTDGARVSVEMASVKLTFSGTTLMIVTESFPISNLKKIYFSASDESGSTGIESVKTATGAQPPRPAVVAAPKPVQIQTPQARPNVQQASPIARPNVQSPVVGRPTVQPVVQQTPTPVIARPNIQQTRPTETPVVQQPQQTNIGSVNQPTIQQPVVNTPPTQPSGVGQEPPKANPVMRLIAVVLAIIGLIILLPIPIPFLGGIIKYVVGAILIVGGAIFFFLGKPKV